MGITREEFEDQLYDIWGKYLGYPAPLLNSPGSGVMHVDGLNHTSMVHLYKLGKRSLLQCDIELLDLMANTMQQIVQRKGPEYAMTGADIQVELINKKLDYDHVELMYYLYPDDFVPHTTTGFEVRQLSPSDKDALDTLKSACTKEDVDEAWVHITDELCFGAFDGETMVACATMYDWRGFADPGVLVHPGFRRRGLGRAVVSPICRWVLDQGRVIDYRCITSNAGSIGVAKSLGFTLYFELEVFKVVNYA